MRPIKLYLETSVWNFYYADDAPEKKAVTQAFFKHLPQNKFEIYISNEVLKEFQSAPVEKQRLLADLIQHHQPLNLQPLPAIEMLAAEYIRRRALPRRAIVDATHIAFASFYEIDFVVSWNLRHIANVNRQEKVQGINFLNGYTKLLNLITPMEVSNYEGT